MRSPSATQAPSSVKSVTPAAAISAIGARAVPSRPTVIAPATATSQLAPRARSCTWATTGGGVAGGLRVGHRDERGVPAERPGPGAGLDRLGLLATRLAQVRVQVDQPRTDRAARGVEHVGAGRRVDAVLDGGDPAVDHEHVAAPYAVVAHDGAARDEERARAHGAAVTRAGSPPRTRKRIAMRTATPLCTWRVTSALGRVGDARGDLDAARHRPRVRDDGVGLEPLGALRGEPVGGRVLGERRDARPAPPLGLEPQHRHHVGLAERVVEARRRRRRPSPARRAAGASRGAQRHVRAERVVGEDLAARDAGVPHVADDEHAQPVEDARPGALRRRRRAARRAPRARSRRRAAPGSGARASRRPRSRPSRGGATARPGPAHPRTGGARRRRPRRAPRPSRPCRAGSPPSSPSSTRPPGRRRPRSAAAPRSRSSAASSSTPRRTAT